MNTQEMIDKMEITELVNEFANLADEKDAVSQGELFLEDGKLEFQMGPEGEIKDIVGREALVTAFASTINPCKAVYHLNGQTVVTMKSETEASGIAYCQATLVNENNGKDIVTINDVRYSDEYVKADGRWYIKKRRTTFMISESHEYQE